MNHVMRLEISKHDFIKLPADSRYGAANLRETAVELGLPVIPYPKNQFKGIKGILRVDRKSRSHGSTIFKIEYKKRVTVERVPVDLRIWRV